MDRAESVGMVGTNRNTALLVGCRSIRGVIRDGRLADEDPVSNISWNDASAFCKWLSRKAGKHVRLPTDVEFETAMRADPALAFFSGGSPARLAGYANVADESLRRTVREPKYGSGCFPFDDGYPFTSPVGEFKPNSWGLYDTIGNVFQWCSVAGIPKPCGCSYNDGPEMCRQHARERHAERYSRYAYFGFRVVVDDRKGGR